MKAVGQGPTRSLEGLICAVLNRRGHEADSPADRLRLKVVGRNVPRADRQRASASRSLSGRHEIVLIDNYPAFR